MKSILTALIAGVALVFVTFAQAQLLDPTQDNGFIALHKPGQTGPEVWVFTRAVTASMDEAATNKLYSDIAANMQKEGYVVIPQSGFDYQSAGVDGQTRCDVSVAVIGTRQPSPNVDIKCGPANTYGTGLYVVKAINSMTARQPLEEARYIVEHIENAYRRAVTLRLFETAFARH